MLVIGGLQLSVLGILGEYIGSIFDEVKGRPLYVVEQVITNESHEASSDEARSSFTDHDTARAQAQKDLQSRV